MKNISKIIAVIATTTALTATAAYANGGGTPASTVTALASANVVTPVTISQAGDGLSFGTFAADQLSNGVIDTSGHVISGVVNVITPGVPATFNTSGVPGNSYTIIAPPNPVMLVGSSGGGFTMPATLVFPTSPRTLNGSGVDSFNVTGTLAVAAGQQIDNYSANYIVSVHY